MRSFFRDGRASHTAPEPSSVERKRVEIARAARELSNVRHFSTGQYRAGSALEIKMIMPAHPRPVVPSLPSLSLSLFFLAGNIM